MFKVASLSFWHVHAPDYVRDLLTYENTKLVAVWDEVPTRGKEAAERYGADFHTDLHELLAREDIDGVIVTTPTNMHAEVMVAAARAGKHIFTEKVLATTVAEADQILNAVDASGVKLIISFPQRSQPDRMFVKQAVEQGLLGDVNFFRCRVAHNGASSGWLPTHFFNEEQCGGGAMIDLGAHPMYLAPWIMGKPKRVTARLTRSGHGYEVDDNSVAIIEFESGAMAIAETSFVSSHSPSSLEVYGTEGSVLVRDGVRIRSNLLKAGEISGWISPQLPRPDRPPMLQWIEWVVEGRSPSIATADARQLTELMEAAYRSHREGRTIELPL